MALVGVVIVPPVPDTMLHTPVPIEGAFAARVTVVNPQVAAPVWSGPAFETVGAWLKVTTTSSVEEEQAVEMVHRKVYVLPAVPVNVDVRLDGVVTVPPVPDTIVHAPVPDEGALPASVTVVNPHVATLVWSAPAAAVEGAALTTTAMVAAGLTHPPTVCVTV